MAIFSIHNAHDNCRVRIQNYLERGNNNPDRELARDFLNFGIDEREQNQWAAEMDKTRNIFDLNGKYHGKDRVTFYHIILSPDPKDEVDLDTLREFAKKFAEHFFGNADEYKNGVLGTAQVEISYHNDNKNNIPHAHLVVNNCNLDTGEAIHIDRSINHHTMSNYVQQLCQEYNLTAFETKSAERQQTRMRVATQGQFRTKQERALAKQNKYVWKDDLRNRIDLALRTSSTPEELKQQLDNYGVEVSPTQYIDQEGNLKDDYIYSLKTNPARWRCTGYRLGQNYVQTKILDRQDMDLSSQRRSKRAGWTSGINNYVQEETQKTMTEKLKLPSDFFENNSQEVIEEAFLTFVSLFDRPPDSQPISSVMKKTRVIGMFRIENRSELNSEIKTQENLANKFPSDKTFEQNAEQLKEARSFIQENNLFAGAPKRTGRQLYRIQQLKEERADRTSSEDKSPGGSSRSTDSPSHYVERSRGRSR